jgi:hypothetical protein
MQTSNDGGLLRSVTVVCLLVLAVAMIAMAVSAAAQRDFSNLPQVVYDTFKTVIGNI